MELSILTNPSKWNCRSLLAFLNRARDSKRLARIDNIYRETDRQTDRQTDRDRDRQRQRQTDREISARTHILTHIHTLKHTYTLNHWTTSVHRHLPQRLAKIWVRPRFGSWWSRFGSIITCRQIRGVMTPVLRHLLLGRQTFQQELPP